ncbi:hypothetical protein DL93DRAFT_2072374 [Clavulina sp. PMI_390]|nr:hypothetical protein DL93DRAFT_2072374 [Clavulina sp. PMI_390]
MTEESTSLSDDLDAIFLSKAEGETSRVGKRASNVLKLAQEKEELMAKLREMTERLELAERRREALEARHRGGGASVDLSKPPVSGPPPSSFRNMPSSSVAPTPPIGNPALRATSQSAPSTPVPPPNNNNNHSSAFTRAQASGNLPSNPPSRLGSLGGVDYNDRPLPSPPPTAPLASGRV